ncbi:DUF2059 domain-containing protein [Fuscovulum blasticum]|uniref:DUF2059 domain-containing protein n=1 Tax=Fuscovulum blasticum TaxID=1075 RepID=UPI000D3E0E26|nr:DUF2059 domain-containing protein [Fuscovulum blasticum]AWD21034.1 hypothetical protein B6K69_04555 [Fuscovulum blasticum]
MCRSVALLALLALTAPLPLAAEGIAPGAALPAPTAESGKADSSDAAALATVLQLDPTFALLAEEARPQADALEEQFFPGRGGAAWAAEVAALYDPAVLRPRFDAAFAQALAGQGDVIPAALAFYGSDLGQRILTQEIAARRAMLDVAADEAAEVAAQDMRDARSPRLRLIRDLITAGDLLESGVAGSLSAELAFSDGMAAGSPAGVPPPRDERMRQVWAEEPSIRGEVGAWLVRFLVLAYTPLSDEELKRYLTFSETPEGRAVTAAINAAMTETMTPVSEAMGRLTARFAISQQI